MAIESTNPATEEVIKRFTEYSDEQIETALQKAQDTFTEWKTTSFTERSKLLKKVANILLDKKEQLAKVMALEMGKPLKGGIAEIEKCALVCNFYADNAATFLKDEHIKTDNKKSNANHCGSTEPMYRMTMGEPVQETDRRYGESHTEPMWRVSTTTYILF